MRALLQLGYDSYVTFKEDSMDLVPLRYPASGKYRVVILIKNPVQLHKIEDSYFKGLKKLGVKKKEILVVGFEPQGGKVDTVGWLVNNLDLVLKKSKCKLLMVCDSKMYEYITGVKSSKGHCSYDKSKIFDYEVNCVPIINYRAINYNIQLAKKLVDGMNSIGIALNSLPKQLNIRDVEDAYYPTSQAEIEEALWLLLEQENLAVDIEAFSLSHLETGIGTISFSQDKKTAVCFSVEYVKLGERTTNDNLRGLLAWFFKETKAMLYFHRAQYDVKILIFDLFMKRKPNNYAGFVEGAKCFRNFEDTMLLTYVCTNNTTQNVLNLKDNTIEYSGNYAIDIKDITKHEPSVVREYNARDTCNTMYLWEKYVYTMLKENQVEAYEVLKATVLPLIQADIHGIHIDIGIAKKLKKDVGNEIKAIQKDIAKLDCVNSFRIARTKEETWNYNLTSKTKVKKVPKELIEFNANSGTQTADLIHTFLNVDVVDTTKTGLPSMSVDSISALKNTMFPKS